MPYEQVCPSLWIEQGHNPKQIQTLMGHFSIKVTFDTARSGCSLQAEADFCSVAEADIPDVPLRPDLNILANAVEGSSPNSHTVASNEGVSIGRGAINHFVAKTNTDPKPGSAAVDCGNQTLESSISTGA